MGRNRAVKSLKLSMRLFGYRLGGKHLKSLQKA
jgi:hypothetical protein